MTKLYLVRHGETEWNKASKIQGRTDIELSEEGIKQAQTLAKRLAYEDINAIYSSSLKRALRTAEIIAEYNSCEIIESDKYHEIGLGPWEGMTINDIEANYNEHFRIYREDPANFNLPGAETFYDVTERTYNAILDIVARHKGSNILLVSHGVTIKAAIIKIMGIDISNYNKFKIDNASISIIGFPEDIPEKPIVFSLNDTNHLNNKLNSRIQKG